MLTCALLPGLLPAAGAPGQQPAGSCARPGEERCAPRPGPCCCAAALLRQHLHSSPCRPAGKSTLLNALLGAAILPSTNVPETARVCRITSVPEGPPTLTYQTEDQRAVTVFGANAICEPPSATMRALLRTHLITGAVLRRRHDEAAQPRRTLSWAQQGGRAAAAAEGPRSSPRWRPAHRGPGATGHARTK